MSGLREALLAEADRLDTEENNWGQANRIRNVLNAHPEPDLGERVHEALRRIEATADTVAPGDRRYGDGLDTASAILRDVLDFAPKGAGDE